MPAVLGRGIQLAQVRAVGQHLVAGRDVVRAEAPQQGGTGGPRRHPQLEADKAGQAQHAGPQVVEQPARERRLADVKMVESGGEYRVGSASASRRSWGKALSPREAAGRPKRVTRSGASGRSMVVPSRLTSRRPRKKQPGSPGWARGRATRRYSSAKGAGPRRRRALVIEDLVAKARLVPPRCSQRTPSSRQRSTSP